MSPGDKRRDLLISLVNTNNRELLRSCLDSLPGACGELTCDVSVIDNASDDGSAEMVRSDYPRVRLIVNTRRLGFSANHNQNLVPAMREASHRYLCVLNEDIEFSERALAEIVSACDRDPSIGVAGPRIHGRDGEPQPSLFRYPTIAGDLRGSLLRTGNAVAANGWLNGSCLVLRTETLAAIGPLDERFFIFFEDTDLSRRLAVLGLRAAVISAARMLHHGHSTVASPQFGSASERQMLRSRYLYYDKHVGRRYAALAVAGMKSEHLIRALKAAALATGGREGEREKLKVLLSLIRYNPRHPLEHEVNAHEHARA